MGKKPNENRCFLQLCDNKRQHRYFFTHAAFVNFMACRGLFSVVLVRHSQFLATFGAA